MARNKKHLEGLLEIIKQISLEDGNSWFIETLSASLSHKITSAKHSIDNPKIDDIHEFFFRKIVEEQAEQFYSTISYDNQKKDLVKDFMKMEYARRVNDFENFCLSMFQQVELIINSIFENENIHIKVIEEKNKIIRDRDRYMICNFIAKSKKYEHIQELYSRNPKAWSFDRKFRSVVVFKYHEKATSFFNVNFLDRICLIATYLRLGRNEVHRGAIVYDNQEKKIDEIRNNPQEFYMRFLGFLEEFVSLVCKENSIVVE